MKLVLQGIAFVSIFVIIYLAIMNGHTNFDLQVWVPSYDPVSQMTVHTTKTLSMAFIMIATLMAGIISGICLFVPFYLAQTEQMYAYKRELEKNSIKADSSSSQVKVLQAKIVVLEKALKEALK